MNRVILQLLCCCVAVLALLSAAEATSQRPKRSTPLPRSTAAPSLNLQSLPCDGVTCPSGRQCGVDENHRPVCVCDGNCVHDSGKVCGSDRRTYSSSCSLKREACRTNTNLTVIYDGECQRPDSPCTRFSCPSGRECAVSDGRAICVCSQDCPTDLTPVCGSNNRTYMNECDLRRHSCMNSDDITLAYQGQCQQATACKGFICPTGMQCAIDERHQPTCVCVDSCPDSTDAVCGSDGLTYSNECELRREACTSGTNVTLVSEGYCPASACSGFRCPSDKECSVDENNQPVCACIRNCPYENKPVCGSDGNSYWSLCELRSWACTTGINITVARNGRCSYDEFCLGVFCPSPKRCVVDAQNQTSCSCDIEYCKDGTTAVCGSDNKTYYGGACQIVANGCLTNSSINLSYFGVCSEGPNCQGIYCPPGQHCNSENLMAEAKCVCDTFCPKIYDPVCGDNNRTYDNSCELQRDACLTNTSIAIRANGKCAEGPGCVATYCQKGRICERDERNFPRCVCTQSCTYDPNEVCGTDNKTYINECSLTAAACVTNKSIAVQRPGKCQEVDPCKDVVCSSDRYCKVRPNGRPICVCNEQCSRSSGSPVCGSDSRTYSNYCELRKQACLSSSSITWRHNGKCVEASVCDRVQCSSDKRCAVNDRNQATCVCIDHCADCLDIVCGSDGFDYNSECELRKTACMSNTNVTLAYRGRCKQGLTCNEVICPYGRNCQLDEKNEPTCVCYKDCSDNWFFPNAVCGTDGKTYYGGDCNFQIEACLNDKRPRVAYYGICKEDILGLN